MQWTREQKEAIDAEGRNVLVAAGAGSGKTTLLVSRIVRVVLEREQPYNIDDLLVVTFTKAAASDMRAKISEAFEKRLTETNDPYMISRIADQQVRLSRAWISTIDSFCKRLLLENIHESGIDSSYSVCDDAVRKKLFEDAVTEAAEKMSLSEPGRYSALVDVYGSYKSDEKIISLIKDVADSSLSFPDPEGWLKECLRRFKEPFPDGDFALTECGQWMISLLRLRFEAQLAELKRLALFCEEVGLVNYSLTLRNDYSSMAHLPEFFSRDSISWKDAFDACRSVNFARLKSVSAADKENVGPDWERIAAVVKKRRDNVRDEVKKILDNIFANDADTPEIDRINAAGTMETFIDLCVDSLRIFAEEKIRRRLYDFGDMEHRCLEILTGEGSELADSYRRKFSEIYVDEYQDTNLLQEHILKAISGSETGGPPYMFMVGDIKQSVYSFRDACPELFMQKYGSYRDFDTGNDADNGELVRLNANFRSRREVIDSVNTVFSALINNETAGMPYGINEYLNFGAAYYPEVQPLGIAALSDPYKTELIFVDNKGAADKTIPEIHEIMMRIKNMIASRFPVFDSKAGKMRPVRYSDICILLRYMSRNGRKYADYLRSGGVPVKDTEDKLGLFSHPEVRVILSFAKIIDNPLNDIPLISVLKNIYGFTADMLAQIKLTVPGRDVNFFRRMEQFAAQPREGEAEKTRILVSAFLERLKFFRDLAYRGTVTGLMWTCMAENGFLQACGSIPDGGVAYANLMKLIRIAMNFDNGGGGSFCDFVRTLTIYEGKGSVSAASPSGPAQNAVTITTIHKSKGLEYPVVFIAETGGKRSTKSEEGGVLVHRKLGLGPLCYSPEYNAVYPSIMKAAVRLRNTSDSRAEELRVLYVAMTRAREKLIITGSGKDYKDYDSFIDSAKSKLDASGEKVMDYHILVTDDYLSLLAMAALRKGAEEHISVRPAIYAPELGLAENATADGSGSNSGNGVNDVDGGDNDDIDGDEIGGAVRFGLPHIELWEPGTAKNDGGDNIVLTCPSKVSVSEVKRISAGLENESGDDGLTDNIYELYGNRTELRPLGEYSVSGGGAVAGTLLHCCLEHLDYGAVREIGGDRAKAKEYAVKLMGELAANRFFSDEDAKIIPAGILVDYIVSPFALAAAGARRIIREIPFALDYPSDELFSEPLFAGNITTVQGVIDCILVSRGEDASDERIILIDYKSDRVEDGDFASHSRRYDVQLRIYSEVCRRIFGKYPDKTLLYYLRYGREFLI